eukprot:m.3823 g.3823  ORF g.3823 m.3823 type:complete len:629 (+) comp3743_c0_seq2:40-1926(+)
MKYILVTGGVISGIGKGIISSSLGTIVKGNGLTPTSIKIDPYLNIDAGTFSPYEHGEVYVLDDGGEVDLDLGNYERFLDVKLGRDNNITTGKIYQRVIQKERKGDYLGKTVQVVPHLCNEIQDWVETVANKEDENGNKADVCIIELGGTIGDIESMPFVEAFRQFQFRVGKENFMLVHVSLIPQPSSTGEQKTKPTQHSIRELRGLGLSPDFIVCRSKNPLQEGIERKVAMFCHVPEDQVVGVVDVDSIYRVPILLQEQGFVKQLWKRLDLPKISVDQPLHNWRILADRFTYSRDTVDICLVGKYTGLSDAYCSVIESLMHSAMFAGRRLNLTFVEAERLEDSVKKSTPKHYHEAWHKVCSASGILVPGGFGSRGIEGKIAAINWARTNKVPFFGICLGLQLAVIEFCRTELGWEGANSTEVDPETPHPVVIDMPEHHPGDMGGTMRLGKRKTEFVVDDCVTKKLYGDVNFVEERHRHRYEVNPKLVKDIEAKKSLMFVGQDVDRERMEIIELNDHPYFVGVQYHPEFLSRPLCPSPPFLGFVLASCGKLQNYLDGKHSTPLNVDSLTPPQSPTRSQQSTRGSIYGMEDSSSSSIPIPLSSEKIKPKQSMTKEATKNEDDEQEMGQVV